MGKLIIDKLNLYLDKKHILKDINIKLESDDTLIIIGESGAGKSVLTKLLLGSKKKNFDIRGKILLNNEDILSFSDKKWQRIRGSEIAYISQNPMAVFNEYQTIESHIVELFEDKINQSKEEYLKEFIKIMRKLRIEDSENMLKKYPFQFSGGQLQRIMFGMILQLNPEVLIVDEPTSALDFKNTKIILDLLKAFQRQHRILIAVTHDYKFASELKGKTIIMRYGEIVESGDTLEILKNPKTDYGKELIAVTKNIRYEKSDVNE